MGGWGGGRKRPSPQAICTLPSFGSAYEINMAATRTKAADPDNANNLGGSIGINTFYLYVTK